MDTTNGYRANRQYKATLFSKLFGENKENALSLYNAVRICIGSLLRITSRFTARIS